MQSYALALWCAGKALGGFMGGFFTFAGVSKTSGAHGLVTTMSEEMQGGFRSGSFAKIFGVPATWSLPLLYTVGCTEMLAGTTILGYVFGVVPATYAQWASAIAAFITLNATSAHVSAVTLLTRSSSAASCARSSPSSHLSSRRREGKRRARDTQARCRRARRQGWSAMAVHRRPEYQQVTNISTKPSLNFLRYLMSTVSC